MPRYKLSPIERAAEKERKENLRNIMKGLDVKNFDDLKDVFKMMVGEMLENGLDGELESALSRYVSHLSGYPIFTPILSSLLIAFFFVSLLIQSRFSIRSL